MLTYIVELLGVHPSRRVHARLSAINLSSWPSRPTTCRPVSLHILLALADIEICCSKIIVLVFNIISFGLMSLNAWTAYRYRCCRYICTYIYMHVYVCIVVVQTIDAGVVTTTIHLDC